MKVRKYLCLKKGTIIIFNYIEWSEHTRKRNPAQLIMYYLKSEIKCEFVTQAFAKMYECLCSYPLIQPVGDNFFSVHLCEAPVSKLIS